MEQFKDIERNSKLKEYSKEALAKTTQKPKSRRRRRKTPDTPEKLAVKAWIKSQLEAIEGQMGMFFFVNFFFVLQ